MHNDMLSALCRNSFFSKPAAMAYQAVTQNLHSLSYAAQPLRPSSRVLFPSPSLLNAMRPSSGRTTHSIAMLASVNGKAVSSAISISKSAFVDAFQRATVTNTASSLARGKKKGTSQAADGAGKGRSRLEGEWFCIQVTECLVASNLSVMMLIVVYAMALCSVHPRCG